MARHDVHATPDGSGYLLDVQSDLLLDLNTRVVVPLLPEAQAPRPAVRLNPVFRIEDEPHVMATQFLAAVPERVLGDPIGSLSKEADDITAAVDMLTQGF